MAALLGPWTAADDRDDGHRSCHLGGHGAQLPGGDGGKWRWGVGLERRAGEALVAKAQLGEMREGQFLITQDRGAWFASALQYTHLPYGGRNLLLIIYFLN